MTPRQTLKQWFSRGKKPLAAQFAEAFDSFWHKSEDRIEITDIHALPQTLNDKADAHHTHDASDIQNLPTTQVDAAIDPASANPVQNAAIALALEGKADDNHTHSTSDINGLQDALDNKADQTHRHEMGEITGLGEALNDKSDSGHTHTASDIDNFQSQVVELIDEYRPQTDPEPDIQEVVYVADAAALEQVAEPSESTLYITEDTGYFYKYRDGEFELIEDNEDDGTIYCNGSFTNLENLLKQYTSTGSYDVVLIQANNQIATYRFVCSSNSQKINQTLTKDQRDGTNANIRTRTGTVRTVNDEPVITWSAWTIRTPLYQESTFSNLKTTAKTIIASLNELWDKITAAVTNLTERLANYVQRIQPVTYAELVALRNAGELVPGQRYRITDYVTTVANDTEARSAGHPFDLIVQAIDTDTLAAEAPPVYSRTRPDMQPARFYSESLGAWFYRYADGDAEFDGTEYYAWKDKDDNLAYSQTLTPADDTEVYVAIDSNDDAWGDIADADHIDTFSDFGESFDEYVAAAPYFAKAQLNKWKVWYDINNDPTQYLWADSVNGKGVIYRMIDEHGSDIAYDFKNVQFKRYKVAPTTPVPVNQDEEQLLGDLDGMYIGIDGDMSNLEIVDEDDYIWAYTCSQLNDDGSIEDRSIIERVIAQDEGHYKVTKHCENNIIKPCYSVVTIDNTRYVGQALNNIVMLSGFDENDGDPKSGELRNNTFDLDCCNITLFGFPENNHFGQECTNNIVGGYNNTFGNYCYSNTFGNYCGGNTFGNDCDGNTFGNSCWNNTFGNDCNDNTFGNSCWNNTFGNGCFENTFANWCSDNTFGNDCNDNTFGNDCDGNTFGNYLQYITVHSGVQYVNVVGGEQVITPADPENDIPERTDTYYVRNAQILNGTRGSDNNNRLQISFQREASYCQFAGLNSSGVLKIWVPADAA